MGEGADPIVSPLKHISQTTIPQHRISCSTHKHAGKIHSLGIWKWHERWVETRWWKEQVTSDHWCAWAPAEPSPAEAAEGSACSLQTTAWSEKQEQFLSWRSTPLLPLPWQQRQVEEAGKLQTISSADSHYWNCETVRLRTRLPAHAPRQSLVKKVGGF